METLEKVELVREKTGVSYQDAKEALEANNYDVLDAIIWLEQQGKADMHTASYETRNTGATKTTSLEMQQAQEEYHRTSKKSKVSELWSSFVNTVRKLLRAGMDMTFVAERNGSRSVAIPLLFVLIGILAWGASIWLLIIGLFLGFRYHIEGAEPVTVDINSAMNMAADAAEGIKSDFTAKKAEHATTSAPAPEAAQPNADHEQAANDDSAQA